MLILLLLLPVPFLTAYLNRLVREDKLSRPAFYAINAVISLGLTRDLYFTAIYLVWVVCWMMLPTQAVFTARHGNPPDRQDNKYFDWIQLLTYRIMRMRRPAYEPRYDPGDKVTKYYLIQQPDGFYRYRSSTWKRWGMVFGAAQALFLLPATVVMVFYVESLNVLLSALFMAGRGVYDNLFDAVWMDRAMGFFNGVFLSVAVYCLLVA